MGTDREALAGLLDHKFSKVLKVPSVVIVGQGASNEADGEAVLAHAMKLAEDTNSKLMVLHTAASRVGAMDIDATTKGERPLSGWATALMQLINPKPWTVALAVVSVFVTSTGAPAWLLALLFLLIAVPCMLLWAWLGPHTDRVVRKPTGVGASAPGAGD